MQLFLKDIVFTTETRFDTIGFYRIKARLGVRTIALGKTCIGAGDMIMI